MKCWGYNGSGQLGIGSSYSDATSPTNVPGLTSSVTDVSGNVSNTCAIVSGAAKCWGFNFFGQIGDGTTSQRFDPTSVLTLTSGMTKIATSGMHTCAASSANNVYCWGGNGTGQLGDGTQTLKRVPTTLASPLDTTTVASLALGGSHTCAVTSSGALYCWGSNSFGQVGDGSTTDRSSPTLILSSGVSKVSAAGGSTCALMTTGNLKCWGSNQYGELGINPASTLTPTTVIGGSL